MNDKREGAGGVLHIVADLEMVERKLAEASGEVIGNAEIQSARTLLRTAIDALARTASIETGEEAGAGKRRVKIKAESEVAASGEPPRAGPAAKSGAAATKSTARGARKQDDTGTGQRPQPSGKTTNGSLIARLGAATTDASVPSEITAPAAAPTQTDAPRNDTAERLAQLEAEIDNLTEAVTASPARPAARGREKTAAETSAPSPALKAEEPDIAGDDDDDAEITIVGPAGARVADPPVDDGRQSPRILREGSQVIEEEAEVEIRGSGPMPTGARGADRPGAVRVSARPTAGTKGGALGRWRIFRGS